jgi:hypothetical protein
MITFTGDKNLIVNFDYVSLIEIEEDQLNKEFRIVAYLDTGHNFHRRIVMQTYNSLNVAQAVLETLALKLTNSSPEEGRR